MLKKGDKIGIVGCSNGLPVSKQSRIEELIKTMQDIGLEPLCSDFLYEKYSVFSGTGKERGLVLMDFYVNSDVKAIFDISGGNVANEILEHLDFNIIKDNPKPFFGYSDLTTIVNAIYTKTENQAYLYQIRNLLYSYKEEQIKWFTNTLLNGEEDLFHIKYHYLQGFHMEGVVIGGNIRCFLKLAGTPYMPNFEDKILLLESYGGDAAFMTSYLQQLKHMSAFRKINGILLGTFSEMEHNNVKPTTEELVLKVVDDSGLPIAKTYDIGHGSNSKCIAIGKRLTL